MTHVAIIVDWYGPYTFDDARVAAKEDYADGLYLVIGKKKGERSRRIQYVGVSNNLSQRVSNGHHKIHEVTRDREFWLGEIGSIGLPGKKRSVIDERIDLAESAHAFFLQPPLNDRKTYYAPRKPLTVLNRWWRRDYETAWKRRPHKDWPELIDFTGIEYGARLVWFGGRVERWSPDDF